MLTGTIEDGEPPLNFIIKGGRELKRDNDVFPNRLMMPVDVQALSKTLDEIDHEWLRSRFDLRKMNEAGVGEVDWTDDAQEQLDYLLENFDEIKTGIKKAAEGNFGLLIGIG